MIYADPLIIIPEMPVCNGCGRCCGPVGCTYGEILAITRYIAKEGIAWKARGGLTCGFLAPNNGCLIYPVRPITCRLYGVIYEMTCPFFPEAASMSLSADRLVALGYNPDGPLLADVFGGKP